MFGQSFSFTLNRALHHRLLHTFNFTLNGGLLYRIIAYDLFHSIELGWKWCYLPA